MVVPDRVVQTQRLVAVAPLISGPRMTVQHDGRHPELTQPRAQRDAALPAADDHDVRLLGVAQRQFFVEALLGPRPPVRVGTVHSAERPRRALGLLVSLQFLQGGEQRPGLVAPQAQMADAAAGSRLEFDERRRDVTVLAGRLPGPESGRVGAGQPGRQHVGDAIAAFHGLDVPGKCHQVAPEAVGGELADGAVDIPDGEGGLEVGQPRVHPLLR